MEKETKINSITARKVLVQNDMIKIMTYHGLNSLRLNIVLLGIFFVVSVLACVLVIANNFLTDQGQCLIIISEFILMWYIIKAIRNLNETINTYKNIQKSQKDTIIQYIDVYKLCTDNNPISSTEQEHIRSYVKELDKERLDSFLKWTEVNERYEFSAIIRDEIKIRNSRFSDRVFVQNNTEINEDEIICFFKQNYIHWQKDGIESQNEFWYTIYYEESPIIQIECTIKVAQFKWLLKNLIDNFNITEIPNEPDKTEKGYNDYKFWKTDDKELFNRFIIKYNHILNDC